MSCICLDPECNIPFGKCHCTCGGDPPIASYSSAQRRWVKGLPTLYCLGHRSTCLPRNPIEQPDDPAIRHVPVSQNMFTVVDASDYDDLMMFRWHVFYDPKLKGYYVTRRRRAHEPRGTERIAMHKYLCPVPEGFVVDHANGDTLDNRRINLRRATPEENCRNQKVRSTNISGVTGVWILKNRGKAVGYIASIRHKGKKIKLGVFPSLEQGAEARRAAEELYYGDFRRKVISK